MTLKAAGKRTRKALRQREGDGSVKKMFLGLLALCLLTAAAAAESAEGLPLDALEEARREAWNAYREERLQAETAEGPLSFQDELAGYFQKMPLADPPKEGALTYGDVTMRYAVLTVGEKPENGYPLYIALHGGGGAPKELNDSQWVDMTVYYSLSLTCGVYVAPRGVRDTWDTHFNPESYPLYDRLIQRMILTRDVDPNRVYLLGFSAGGDGVYAVAPRMADRFAGANMSSGHPNGVSMRNMKNLPIQLQAGENDTAYNRNTVTAEYDGVLNGLEAEFGGYVHRTLIHYNTGHNYADYGRNPIPTIKDAQAWLTEGKRAYKTMDSYPPDWLNQFVRNPLPETVIWDLSTRADLRETESFYYLTAPYETDSGLILAAYSREENRITLTAQDVNGPFGVLLNEQMVDFSKPVTFSVNGEETVLNVLPDRTILAETTWERGDPNFQFEAKVMFGLE